MIGSRLGAYEILAELGSGGMGKVYRAEVTRDVGGLSSGCSVALKVIHSHLLEQEGFFQRFLREADIGRTVQHGNVVQTYLADALLHDGTQQNFLVMEYVEGQTLRELLQELERVPEELCRHIGREVAKGLAAIHEAGVVHRDLKPENVLITPDHVVKIMDLGVARLQAEAIRLSQTGAFVGSLEYAAPEQFRSADGEPDGRADLHALGVVLYELSTGQHPYRDEDASRVIGHILNDEPRKAGEVNPQLSPLFEEVIHTLTAKDREQRFASASALVSVFDEGEKSEWWKARAKALRVETKRPLRRIRIPRETALYGRDDDLVRLHSLYEEAKQGDGQVLLIEGEAGIGKTRLVDEFVGQLRQEGEDINFLFGSYPPGGAATVSGAFSEAYREQFGAEGLEEALTSYLTTTPVLIPAFAALLRGDSTPTGAEPLTKDSLQTVFVHATQGLAAERTTIVLIDDLHFAPEDGRALFSSLAMAVPEHRILLIGTMRPGVPEEWTANVTRLEHAEQRSLQRLGPKDLTKLLIEAFRSERLAQELAFRIAQKSDGNPFFAFEIIRGLREGQFIAQQPDGTWVTTRVIEDIEVPSSVMDLVNARVADLTEEERDLLDVASCCGFEFEAGLVADAAGVARIPALKRFGQIERRHRLVRTSGRECVFDHHQVQEALYGSLMPELREEYHAAIGSALEKRSEAADRDPKELDGALCVNLCEHYLKGGMGEKAQRYLDAALDHLEAGYLNDQAIGLADRALEAPDLLQGEKRLDVLLRKNRRLDVLGRREAQRLVLAEARSLADARDDVASLAKVERATGGLLFSTGRYEEAREHYERHLAIAREIGDRQGEGWGAGNLANVYWCLGHFEESRGHYERSLAIARETGDRLNEGRVTGNLGNVFKVLSRYEEARERYERHLAIAREIGDRQGEGTATGNLGNVLKFLGRHEDAREHYERHLAMAREIGNRQSEAIATGNLGLLFHDLGRYEKARERFERQLAITREIGDRRGEGRARGNLGLVLKSLGHYEEAREHCEGHLAVAREIGDRQGEGNATGCLGSVFQSLGRYEEARRHYERYVEIVRETGDRQNEATGTGNLGQVLQNLGRNEEAREHYERHLAIAREIDDRPGEAAATGRLANLFGVLGRYEEAREHYERQLAIAREIGDRQNEAIALVNLGPLWLALGHAPRAHQTLERSLTLCREIGARYPESYALSGLSLVAEEENDGTKALDLANQALDLRREIAHGDGVADSLIQLGELKSRTGEPDNAREPLDEAVDLLRQQDRKPELIQALALLADLTDGDAAAAEAALEDSGVASTTPQTRYYLWKATGKPEHLVQAKRLLDYRVEHAPEEYRESMLKNVRLHRDIMAAWSKHEDAAEVEG